MKNSLTRWWRLHQTWVFAGMAGLGTLLMIQSVLRGDHGQALIDLVFVIWNLWCSGVCRVR